MQDWETWTREHWPSPSGNGRLIGRVLWPKALDREGCCAHTGVCQIVWPRLLAND